LANRAEAARAHYEAEASGTSGSMKNVSQRAIRRTPIPLPPKEEQERIVAIVGELDVLIQTLRRDMML
jgi:type I restriction enzyme S subunit